MIKEKCYNCDGELIGEYQEIYYNIKIGGGDYENRF